MATTNAQRIRRYRTKQKRDGLCQLNTWVSPAVKELLFDQGLRGEDFGRTIERPLLDKSTPRRR